MNCALDMFSAALCRGLIEALVGDALPIGIPKGFSAALCRGLIEASGNGTIRRGSTSGFPRLYVAASLKRIRAAAGGDPATTFSAALCRGLIEASDMRLGQYGSLEGFPRLYVAASLKHILDEKGTIVASEVFRGFMSRPH